MRLRFKELRLRYWLVFAVATGMSTGLSGCGEPDSDDDEEAQDEDDEGSQEEEDENKEESEAELPDPDPKKGEGDSDKDPDNNDSGEGPKSGSEGAESEPEPEPEPEKGKDKPKDDGPKQDVCNETVPAKHYVDNIPAYSQCAQSMNAKIWSNNGINTATSSQGDGWVPTQWGGGYQCTEFAKRYMYFRFGVEKFPNGNAGLWCEGTTPTGLEKKSEPVHGDLIIFGPGACGASLVTGHVGVVDKVDKNKGTVEFVEQNQANRRVCPISSAACFLHAKNNQ